MSQVALWDRFYDDGHFVMHWPAEIVVQFLMRRSKSGEPAEAKVLDLGCGAGRHVWLAAEIGYGTYGVDVSSEAIEAAKSTLAQRGLDATLATFDGERIPFPDETFNLVVCYGVLDHVPFTRAKVLTDEVRRVLVPGGRYLVTLRSKRCASPDDIEGTVGRNEYVLRDECEKGMIQHFFEWDEIVSLHADFRLSQIELKETNRGEGLSVLADSRWHIVAEKEL